MTRPWRRLLRGRLRDQLITGVVAVLLAGIGAFMVFGNHGTGPSRARDAQHGTGTTAPDGSGTPAPSLTTRSPSPSPSPTRWTGPPASGVPMPVGDLPGWRQTFADDFLGEPLDERWYLYDGTPGGDPGGWFDHTHVSQSQGVLNIAGYRQSTPNGTIYATGGMNNAKVFSQAYGRFDIRFRMDHGYGIAYAMLLWPTADVWPPEIDLMEDNGKYRDMSSATLHYGSNDVHVTRTVNGDFTAWHTAELDWTPGQLVYRLDGRVWTTITTSHVPDIPMSIAIQTQAWRCGGSWEGCPNSSTPDRVNLQVDWVVAYARAG